MTMRGLQDRVAVVTGGAGGIGHAVVERLVTEGVNVLVADLDGAAAEAVAKQVRDNGGSAAAASVDVRERDQVDALPRTCSDAFGREPDLFVCNAGHQTFAGIANIPDDEWHDVLDVNAHGSYLTLRMAADCLRRTDRRGAVVTVASIQARMGSVWYAHYSASKAAMLSLTKSFAIDLAPQGTRVNCVAPGVIDTELWAKADREMARMRGVEPGVPKRERIAAVPLGRGGTPQDVASSVAFLLSEEASYITGECLHVCGGDVML